VKNVQDLTYKVFPDISNILCKSLDWLSQRTILTTKNDRATGINNLLLNSIDRLKVSNKSVDSVPDVDNAIHYP